MELITPTSDPGPHPTSAPALVTGSAAATVAPVDLDLLPSYVLRANDVSYRVGPTTILNRVDVAIPAGRLVGIAGGSGAGKTTFIEVLAGLRRPSSGFVRSSGVPGVGVRVGFVPQDDIIHPHLPLRRTLLYAARLRLPASGWGRAPEVVDEVIARLGLTERADVPVGSLSGGQRKRASIGVELLTEPDVLFLDEPTSGLDPQRAAEVVDVLRSLVGRGTTVVMTTHHPQDLACCDHVVFLVTGGRVAFSGSPTEALDRFGVDELGAVYRRIESSAAPRPDDAAVASLPTSGPARRSSTMGASSLRQWLVLSARSAEVMARNRLTLAILVGSPALVIAMMAILFPAGSFATDDPTAVGPSQVAFWMAFSAFFFGLTYGLLQIVTERSVLRRERHAGLHLGAYLGSKVAVLMPVLVAVVAGLLGVLGLVDRLPSPSVVSFPELFVTLVLTAAAGLLIGLAASAAVADPTQATLALPMICFPQVLFGGAIVPVVQMTAVGEAISILMTTRWSFESLGRILVPTSSVAAPGPHAEAFAGSPVAGWVALALVSAVAAVAGLVVLRRGTAVGRR